MIRRPVAALLAVLVAAATLFVPLTPAIVLAAPSGFAGLVADTTCVDLDPDPSTPDAVDVTVKGHGFEPGTTVDIFVSVIGVESFPDPSDTRQVSELGTFLGRVSLPLPAASLEYVIGAVTQGGEGIDANVNVPAPCVPTLSVSPDCADPGGTFDMTFVADHFLPDAPIRVGVIPSDGIVSDYLTTDSNGHLEYTMRGIGPLAEGTYQAAAEQGQQGSETRIAVGRAATYAAAPIELPCPSPPSITLDPSCAPAGGPPAQMPVTITGSGFLGGYAVVTWDVGGSDEEFHVEQVNEDGTFTLQVSPWQRSSGIRMTVRVTQTFPRPDGSDLSPYIVAVRPARVAQARFRVPCRPTATPTLSIDPDCGSPALRGDPDRRYQIGVTATALMPGPVEVVFDAGDAAADVLPPERFRGQVGQDGVLETLDITPLARPIGTYQLSLLQGGQTMAQAMFSVPCALATPVMRPLQPECGPITPGLAGSYPIRVRGRGFYPGAVAVILDPQGTPDELDTTVADDGTFDVQLPGTGRDRGEYTVLARQRDARGAVARASRTFTVPCVEPALTIQPASGPAAFAPTVTGADFPPGTEVVLTWDRGLTANAPVVATTDANGAFTASIYLLPHDLPGKRTLTAGTPADPAAYPGATVDYLVTVGSGQPPGGGDDPGGIITRR